MAVYAFRTSTYARNIYIYGTTSFADLPGEYVEPVKQYAATNFSQEDIDSALAKGYITQEEYDSTMSYKVVEA